MGVGPSPSIPRNILLRRFQLNIPSYYHCCALSCLSPNRDLLPRTITFIHTFVFEFFRFTPDLLSFFLSTGRRQTLSGTPCLSDPLSHHLSFVVGNARIGISPFKSRTNPRYSTTARLRFYLTLPDRDSRFKIHKFLVPASVSLRCRLDLRQELHC